MLAACRRCRTRSCLPLLSTAALALTFVLGPAAPALTQDAARPQERQARAADAEPAEDAAERDKALSDLYALLATAEDENAAKAIAEGIERIWLHSGSPTVDLLLGRAMKAGRREENRPRAQAARQRRRAGAGFHGRLEPARLRALPAQRGRVRRWATCAARWRSTPTTSSRWTASPRSCARSDRRRRRCRSSSTSTTCIPTGRAPTRRSRSCPARSKARASELPVAPSTARNSVDNLVAAALPAPAMRW